MTHTAAPSPAFRLRGVSQERGGRVVLEDVTLDLPAGAITALVGPSGAGKTSLLRLLNRLDDPITGTVEFAGRPLAAWPVRELRRRAGFVFQAPTMLPGTVADNLRLAHALGPQREGTAPLAAVDLARVLEAVELDPSDAARDAARLSGGEQQRVALARALVTRPDALLLDEPTAALDPEVAERLLATIRRIGARGHTVVMVTHRLSEAREASTHTVLLERGRVVEAGPTERLFTHPAEARTRAYLGVAR
ncbi:MAG TPA: ATP-binding cassette domain-containing protein [Gemmatimonadales bacterium]|nr:ATP-binding cassette domain-containing protein [Gemmatimonadales bacterium]